MKGQIGQLMQQAQQMQKRMQAMQEEVAACLLYTSPSPRDS